MMLILSSATEQSSLARISVPRRQPLNQAITDEDVECAASIINAFAATHRLLQKQSTPSVLWHSGASEALVACMHKSSVPKAFKAIYQEQQRLGVKLAADIKQAVTLKAMSSLELQVSQAAAVAAIMEVSLTASLARVKHSWPTIMR